MSALAVYLAGLCDYSDKLAQGERGVVLLLAPDMKQAKAARLRRRHARIDADPAATPHLSDG